jgi:hypothetical protein
MTSYDLWERVKGRYQKSAAHILFRRPLAIRSDVPLISFTFDDFPRSALFTGGGILKRFGLTGTYYASFGLMGKEEPTGSIFVREDLKYLLEQGHELGCHTFGHCHSWNTDPRDFENSIIENDRVLRTLYPATSFQTFSYPVSYPRPLTKKRAGSHFAACRGGGQTFNTGTADLNALRAYFLDRGRSDPKAIRNLIDENRRSRGWLIFATHDVSETPTPFGCTPGFFEDIVRWAVGSGARILPVVQAFEALSASSSREKETVPANV